MCRGLEWRRSATLHTHTGSSRLRCRLSPHHMHTARHMADRAKHRPPPQHCECQVCVCSTEWPPGHPPNAAEGRRLHHCHSKCSPHLPFSGAPGCVPDALQFRQARPGRQALPRAMLRSCSKPTSFENEIAERTTSQHGRCTHARVVRSQIQPDCLAVCQRA